MEMMIQNLTCFLGGIDTEQKGNALLKSKMKVRQH